MATSTDPSGQSSVSEQIRFFSASDLVAARMTLAISHSLMQALIESRCRDLGLSRTDLIRRAGYANIAKGLRRLEALMNGDFDSTKALIAKLAEALDLSQEAIAEAIAQTRQQIREREEQAYRADFNPHAIILSERRVPEQITFALSAAAQTTDAHFLSPT